MYKFLNLVFEDFMFSGKAFHIITPVYDCFVCVRSQQGETNKLVVPV